MQYGPRGVHGEGDYGTSNMVAVDLIGGDTLGPGIAGPEVYASDAGTIDYVCNDGTTVAVRTYNSTTGDYFLYAHLLDNAGLTVGQPFDRGQLIGSLKYGTFGSQTSGCGWAEQGDHIYHLHWMFTPRNGSFQAENCILYIADNRWVCNGGSKLIGIGEYIAAIGGGSGTGGDNPLTTGTGTGGTGSTGGTGQISFFDYLENAMLALIQWIVGVLPDHNTAWGIPAILLNMVKIILRIAFVLLKANFNLIPIFVLVGIAILYDTSFILVYIIVFVLRVIKLLPLA